MKLRIFIFGLFLMFSCSLLAQEQQKKKRSIGLTFSGIGDVTAYPLGGSSLAGAPSYDVKNFFSLGATYVHSIYSWLDIEAGIEYSNYKITVQPMDIPPVVYPDYDGNVSLMTIPITARLNFLKYFFFNGGFLFDIELKNTANMDSQSGVGVICGLGAQYSFDNGFGAFVNGYYKFHSLLPYSSGSRSLFEGGLRIGLTYSF